MGHEVIGIDNFFHPSDNPIREHVLLNDVRLPIDDLVSSVDTVIHLAAQIHVDYSLERPEETFDINVNGTLKILEACKRYGKKLIFASTSEVYGSSQAEFMDSDHPLNPQSPYAVSKLAADKLCQNYKDMYGMDINIVRNFNTFGPYQNDTSYGGVIAKFTKAALKNEPIHIYGDGLQSRDYMYIDDALQAYMLALDTKFPGPVNFGSGKTVSIIDLAHLIKTLAHSQSEIVHVSPRPGEVQRLCADITFAKSLGFNPTTDFERDLGHYINWKKEEL